VLNIGSVGLIGLVPLLVYFNQRTSKVHNSEEKKLVPHDVCTNEVINLNSKLWDTHIREVERRHWNPPARAAVAEPPLAKP
jgi:hypothetical protein